MAVESGKIQFQKQKTRRAGVSDQSLLSKITSMKGITIMKNVIIFEAEYTEVAPKLEVKHVDAAQLDESIFAQMDWEIDSIMREIGAR